jgi:hypothetical protein
MTANEDMSIKNRLCFDLKVSEEEIVNTSQMAMDHLNKLYTKKFGIAGGAITRIMTLQQQGLDAHTTLLKLARVATRSNLFIDLRILQDSLDYFKDTEESYMAFRKSKG